MSQPSRQGKTDAISIHQIAADLSALNGLCSTMFHHGEPDQVELWKDEIEQRLRLA
jgi:hypothetical protein